MATDAIDALMAGLNRYDEIGNRVHALVDVRHALPLIVLTAGLDVTKLSAGMQELMAETVIAAGVDPQADPAPDADALIAAIAAWYQENPVAPGVLEEIRKAFEQLPEGPSARAQALLGQQKGSGVLGGGVRPEGTIPAALGRLSAMAPKKK
jgi:hypothetical protein